MVGTVRLAILHNYVASKLFGRIKNFDEVNCNPPQR